MRYLNGCTFGYGSPRGFTEGEQWRQSLALMRSSTGCDTVVLAVAARQEHAYATRVETDAPDVMSMADVAAVCREAHRLGMRVVVKAMVDCRDGYWRAYIRFFDEDVPGEPTWAQWFDSYGAFVCRLAETAQSAGADMLCVGCEMVGADHREREWRALIAQVRTKFAGPLTYNCDKYQEERVAWWDALDAASSSGYYPVDRLEENFARVEAVSRRTGKPFFFMESGCPSRAGSEMVPNDWRHGGAQCLESQTRWYEAYTQALIRHPLIRGAVWWDWSAALYPIERAATDNGYALYGKPAAAVVRAFSERIREREGTSC